MLKHFLDRQWMLQTPATKCKTIMLKDSVSFKLLQDDLLHPVLGGNKLRKLDALIPILKQDGVTDVVTCGGLQSAHTAAMSCACSEFGMNAHLLVRGERPKIPTGYHLLSRMYGDVHYVSRAEYHDRNAMFKKYVDALKLEKPRADVFTVPEGASSALSCLGLIRLIDWLCQTTLDPNQPHSFIVDSGTGTTACGLAIGIALLGLPWYVRGIMLAGDQEYYQRSAEALQAVFTASFPGQDLRFNSPLPLLWTERHRPRKFGNILDGEIAECRQIAQQHGVLLDPIWSLASWELASSLARESKNGTRDSLGEIVMLHTGGGLGLHGLAQRFPDQF